MTSDLFSLQNKIAIVTGGGTGLGFGITKAFIEAGATVIITGRREHKLEEAVEKLGKNAHYIVNDVTEFDTLPGLVGQVESDFGPIDILVNNAGVNMKKPLTEVTDEEFNDIIQTNVNGLFSLTREVAKKMLPRGKGSIINITSMAAMYGITDVTAYTSSKTAVLGMTRSLAVDLSGEGIRVNAIAPGFIDSPMLREAFDSDPAREKRVMDRTPMNKLGQADDIAAAAVYLASDAAKFVTGVNLPVDGGNSIGF
ncbi:SDR family NAD(P)-dependent oxidoreductase [Gracilimonas mengyeensis]|uniref:Gluconate 5-dehydrogenase n=1 Tax=Gracilimonas mengyeensis TaxID=1302730 RepID=A0A521B6E9_9BACT|nr:glucose 1-dehydrogenase [Gracilimonas mengyeensis]SMO42646.1 gluconate 5-dehydrogenase [Gracilimonas mengyeensis]